MDDDFNSALALGVVFETVRSANRFMAEIVPGEGKSITLLHRVRIEIAEIGQVLGLFHSNPGGWLEKQQQEKAGSLDITADQIEALIIERAEARKAKNFARGDEIRDYLLEKGIQLLDSAQGTTWKAK